MKKTEDLKSTQGGKRKGAGRKKGFKMKESDKKEPTKVMRIPISLVPKVEKLLSQS